MSLYKMEKRLIAYCGIYCRTCDWYNGTIRNSAKKLLEIVEKHGELKAVAEMEKSFSAR